MAGEQHPSAWRESKAGREVAQTNPSTASNIFPIEMQWECPVPGQHTADETS